MTVPACVIDAAAAYIAARLSRVMHPRIFMLTRPTLSEMLVSFQELRPNRQQYTRNLAFDLLSKSWPMLRKFACDHASDKDVVFPDEIVEIIAAYDCTSLQREAGRQPGFEGRPGYPLDFLHCLPLSPQAEYRDTARDMLHVIWPVVTGLENSL